MELDSRLQGIARHLSELPDTLQSRYFPLVERKLKLGRRDIKRLMKQQENGNHRLYSEIKERQLHFMGEPLGNFWARISHELIVDDGLNPPTVRYSIEGGLAAGQPLRPVQVDARSFGKLDWVPDNWGMRPIITLPPGKSYLVARAIQEVSMESVQREKLYTFTGWNESDNQRGFLSTSGLMTASGLNDQIRVDLGANNLRHYVSARAGEEQGGCSTCQPGLSRSRSTPGDGSAVGGHVCCAAHQPATVERCTFSVRHNAKREIHACAPGIDPLWDRFHPGPRLPCAHRLDIHCDRHRSGHVPGQGCPFGDR